MKYEYKHGWNGDNDPSKFLNALGADGWRLVSREAGHFIFERPIVPEVIADPEAVADTAKPTAVAK